MQITLNIENLDILVKGLNNAVISFGNVASALLLHCDVPKNLEPLQTLPEEEIRKRFDAVLNIYKQLEEKLEI